MRILDLSAGNRAVWLDKNNPYATFIDIRDSVKPTFVADSRSLPEEVGKDYDLIVFDPPHLNFGKTSNMAKVYGHHTQAQIMDLVEKTAKEAHRVAKPSALMAFKWNDHDTKLKKILSLMETYWEPLFGHHTRNGPSAPTQTFWVMLKRIEL